MKARAKERSGLTREIAMAARPYPVAGTRIEDDEDGTVRVAMHCKSTRMQRWFGAPPEYDRSYVLDLLGREVLDACTGEATVAEIAETFAQTHQVNPAEAEMAVTKYLKTLMTKGIIGMALQ